MPPQVISNLKDIKQDTTILSLNIKVTSLAFFSKFVIYADSVEGLEQEAFKDEKKRTLFISERETLRVLFASTTSSRTPNSTIGIMDGLRWRAVSLLRYKNAKTKSSKSKTKRSAFDDTWLSDFDKFVIGQSEGTSPYRRNTTRLLVASKIAFGHEGLVHVLDLLLRGGLIYLATVVQSANVSPLYAHVWAFAKGS
jgi:hypothetical protein